MGRRFRWYRLAVLAAVAGVGVLLWPRAHAPATKKIHSGDKPVPFVAKRSPSSSVPEWLEGSPRRRWLAGRVTSEGEPVAHARVRLASRAADLAGAPILDAATGSDGRFDFGLQRITAYTLAASAPGKTEAILSFDLEDPRLAADRLELSLGGCSAVVEGTISDAAGIPVEKARVRRIEAASVPLETDASGRFRLCAGSAEAHLRIEADGDGPTFLKATASAPAKVTLAPPARVVGRCVTEDDGEPVAGAVVAVGSYPEILWTLSDGSGHFEVPVGPGARNVHGFSVDRQSIDVFIDKLEPGRATGEIVLVLRPAARVAGHVVADGKPVGGVPVSVGKGAEAYGIFPAYSQADGDFVLERLLPGYYLMLETPGYFLRSPRHIEPTLEPSAPITVEIATYVNLHGRVLRDGAPVADAEVSCKGPKEAWVPVRSGPGGEYLCEKLASGHHVVSAEDAAGAFSDDIDVELKPGEDRELDIELAHSASISGILVDESGQPVAGATVHFAAGDDDGEAKTEDDGRFRVDALAGRAVYQATVWPPNARNFSMEEARSFRSVDVPGPRSQVTGIRLEVVRKPPPIDGTVFDETDQPAAGVMLSLRDRPGGAPLAQAVSGSDGSFRFQPPERATYEIDALAQDGSDRDLHGVRSGDRDIHLRLDAPIGIDGTLAGFRTEVEVIVVNAGRIYTLHPTGNEFRLHGLKLGPCIVAAKDGYKDGQLLTVTLTERTPVPVTLTALKAARVSLELVDATTRGPANASCHWGRRLGDIEIHEPQVIFPYEGRDNVIVPPGDVFIVCGRSKVALTVAPGEVRSLELAVESQE